MFLLKLDGVGTHVLSVKRINALVFKALNKVKIEISFFFALTEYRLAFRIGFRPLILGVTLVFKVYFNPSTTSVFPDGLL